MLRGRAPHTEHRWCEGHSSTCSALARRSLLPQRPSRRSPASRAPPRRGAGDQRRRPPRSGRAGGPDPAPQARGAGGGRRDEGSRSRSSAPARTASSCARRTGSTSSGCAPTRSSTRAGSHGRGRRRRHVHVPPRAPDPRGHARRASSTSGSCRTSRTARCAPRRLSEPPVLPAAPAAGGKFKAPFGLERLQSATAMMFIERAFPTLLVPNRDLGVMLHGELARGPRHYQLGAINGVRDGGSAGRRQRRRQGRRRRASSCTRSRPARERSGSTASALGVAGELGPQSTSRRAHVPHAPPGQANFFAYARRSPAPRSPAKASASAGRRRPTGTSGPFGLLGEYVRLAAGPHGRNGGSRRELRQRRLADRAASYVLTGENASYKGRRAARGLRSGQGRLGRVGGGRPLPRARRSTTTRSTRASRIPSVSRGRRAGWTRRRQLVPEPLGEADARLRPHLRSTAAAPAGGDRRSESIVLTRARSSPTSSHPERREHVEIASQPSLLLLGALALARRAGARRRRAPERLLRPDARALRGLQRALREALAGDAGRDA